MRRRNLLLPILCILLALGSLGIYKLIKNKENAQYVKDYYSAQEYNEALKELREVREKLDKGVEELKKDLVLEGKGSTIILISDTDLETVKGVSSQLDGYKYIGVIAIDDNNNPEYPPNGYANKEDIDELVKKGYEIVLKCDSKSSIVDLYNKYTNLGYEIKGLYFPNNDMTNNQLEKAKSLELSFLITYGKTYDEKNIVNIMTIGSNEINALNIYKNAVEQSKTIVLSVGCTKNSELYSSDNIKGMLKLINQYETLKLTKAVGLVEAKERYDQYQADIQEYINNDSDKLIQELEDKLEELETKLGYR